jgi:hypothetical protein
MPAVTISLRRPPDPPPIDVTYRDESGTFKPYRPIGLLPWQASFMLCEHHGSVSVSGEDLWLAARDDLDSDAIAFIRQIIREYVPDFYMRNPEPISTGEIKIKEVWAYQRALCSREFAWLIDHQHALIARFSDDHPEAPPAAVAKPPDKPRPGPPIQLALDFKDGSFFAGYGKGFPRPNFWKHPPKNSDAHQQWLWKGSMKRCKGICEACGENPAKLLHHLNYKRYGHELLTDVVGVCLECHGEFHPEKI